jgi:pyruvate-ferredoxin/flavodoxin oxidoreductase
MSYGYVYVAQIALGANQVQALRAIHEAEAFPGPSIIIAYAPCISHGIKGGLKNMISEEKLAVKYGYWHLYRCVDDCFISMLLDTTLSLRKLERIRSF